MMLFFQACGGGSTTKESLPLKRLYLIDSPINGVDYECGIRKFTTHTYENKEGVALCRHSPVTFKLGSLVLGKIDEIQNNQEIYPQDLVGVSRDNFDDERVVKLSLLLQSLDNDGEINHTIDIKQQIKDKIDIGSLKNLSLDDTRTLITKLGKEPLRLEDVDKHLREHSGIVSIEEAEITLKDTTAVGTTVALLNMTNHQNISNIKILKGEGKEFFVIGNDGAVKLAKALDYKLKRSYTFQIQATNPIGKSNIANLKIHVESGSSEDLSFIDKPLLQKNIFYTNSNEYNISISGRADTQIYIDNISTGRTMPITGIITLTRQINGADRSESHTITLSYPNGIVSEPTPYTIVKDTKAPNIITPSVIIAQENSSMVTSFEVEDSNKDKGLDYTLSGKDAQLFKISNVGEIAFELPADFEMPRDYNADNIYDITLTVEDKANNKSNKEFHIILKDILDSKPVILPFYEEISTAISVGSTIGKLSIFEGSSPISNLTLTGENAEKFQLNSDGSIQLLEKMTVATDYMLTVTATNSFGSTQQNIFIHCIEGGQIGKIEIGTLSNATIKIIKLNSDNSQKLLNTNKTQAANTFHLRSDLLDNESFYIYEVSDGTYTDTNKKNKAVFRLISKGSWIKQSSKKVKITPMSEMLYDYVAKYIKEDYTLLESKLHESSKILLSKDLNNDFSIDAKDLLGYSEVENHDALYRTLKKNNTYPKLVTKMLDANSSYIEDLFQTRVLKSFKGSDDFKLVGSFVYYFNAKNGIFYIYDIQNQRQVAELFLELPDYELFDENEDEDINVDDFFDQLLADVNSYRVSLTVDLESNRVYLTNLNYKTFIIEISNLRSPTLLSTFNSDLKSTIIAQVRNNLFIHSYPSFAGTDKNYMNGFTYIYNMEDETNITKDSPALAPFNKIQNGKSYYFNTSKCNNETNNITLTTQKVSDIMNNNENNISFDIYSYYCNEKAFFDNDHAYVYDGTYLEIYSIDDETLTYEAIESMPISNILNIENHTLYSYYENVLSFIDVSDIKNPFIKKRIPYYVEENFWGETILLTNNLPIAIKDGYFITAEDVVDLNSFSASAPYTENKEGIDLTLFERFSN